MHLPPIRDPGDFVGALVSAGLVAAAGYAGLLLADNGARRRWRALLLCLLPLLSLGVVWWCAITWS